MMAADDSQGGSGAIRAAFETARAEGRSALITYLTVGYPSLTASLKLVPALQAGGADIIELGVPFSDPVADGPTIQHASQAALELGVTPKTCLDLVVKLRQLKVTVPLVLMGYYNPIYSYGLSAYARDCADEGVDGLIVPDLPLEEAAPFQEACQREGLALVFLIAPTSGEERIRRIAAATHGFLYVVSRLGTTGKGGDPDPGLAAQLALVRRYAKTPVAVGFGVSSPEQVRILAQQVDGVIVGSALIERAKEGSAVLQSYVASLYGALSHTD